MLMTLEFYHLPSQAFDLSILMQASWKERRVGSGVGEDIHQEKSVIIQMFYLLGRVLCSSSSPQSMMGMKCITTVAIILIWGI